MRSFWPALGVLAAPAAWSQDVRGFILDDSRPIGEGWSGFLNFPFLAHTALTLLLAAVLGAVIAHHPKHAEVADTFDEIEAPKVYILYAVVGAIIGMLVAQYGMVVGMVLFGIGGLMRFRTELGSANQTGRLILVTLIGLTAGLDMPHVAVLATLFGFVLIFVVDSRVVYRVDVRGLTVEQFADATAAYRRELEDRGCRIFAEKKNPLKQHVRFIFGGPRGVGRAELEAALDSGIEPSLKGAVDWGTD